MTDPQPPILLHAQAETLRKERDEARARWDHWHAESLALLKTLNVVSGQQGDADTGHLAQCVFTPWRDTPNLCRRCSHTELEHQLSALLIAQAAQVEELKNENDALKARQQENRNEQEAVMNQPAPGDLDDARYLDLLTNPPVGMRFHWRDGWYFQRTALGAVLVTLPDHSQKVIPPTEWASIVASVCVSGETHDTYQRALSLHVDGLAQ